MISQRVIAAFHADENPWNLIEALARVVEAAEKLLQSSLSEGVDAADKLHDSLVELELRLKEVGV